jgi:hypothetical protein
MNAKLFVAVLGGMVLGQLTACSSDSDGGVATGGSSGSSSGGSSGDASGGAAGDAAGGTGTGGAAGSGIGGAPATGGASGAAGSGGSGGDTNVTVGTCDDFTPCGGDPVGTWTYQSGCISLEDLGLLQACATATADLTGTAQGTLIFTETTVARTGTLEISGVVHVPTQCVVGGCLGVQTLMAMAYPGTTCAATADGCDCTIQATFSDWDAAAYTVTGNTITAGGRTFDFCVDGSSLTYTETTPQGGEPGTYVLTK